jgi:hypothetical protein
MIITILASILLILLGLLTIFFGLQLFKFLSPIFAFVISLTYSIKLFESFLGQGVVSLIMGILLGIMIGIFFALISYYAIMLVVMGLSIYLAYFAGTNLVYLFGFENSGISIIVGILFAIVFSVILVLYNLPKYFIIIITAIGGVILTVTGINVLTGDLPLNLNSYILTAKNIIDSFPMIVGGVIVALLGIFNQKNLENDSEMNEDIYWIRPYKRIQD